MEGSTETGGEDCYAHRTALVACALLLSADAWLPLSSESPIETGGEDRRQGHRGNVGSYGGGGAYERGTPVVHSMVD